MKKKTGASKNSGDIREIDVADLIKELSRNAKKSDDAPPRELLNDQTQKNPAVRPHFHHDGPMKSDSTNIVDQSNPSTSSNHPSISNPGKLSKSKKQKLRLLRKLQERQSSNPQIPPFTDSASDSENAPHDTSFEVPSSPEGSKKNNKQKRNYVERTSSSTGGSSCSWKDVMCVLLVLIAVFAAGALKFQEEMFGSVERMRLETDSDADYYEILGITHAASMKEIKRAYRNKVLEVHPDHHPNCSDCQEKFIVSTKAYETLIDDEKRKIYDQTRGSYEPILSDHSVSLTSFNYHKLVSESPHVWVIQVFDDLDGNSRYFGTHWDTVAGSDLSQIGIKFGRVNIRRDKAVLPLLPMRAKMFPTVIMFSRDTMPSIFSLADISSKALKRWILAYLPSHIGESNSYARYRAVVSGGKAETPLASLKVASIKFAYVFDVDYRRGSGKTQLEIIDKHTNSVVITESCVEKDCALVTMEDAKRRLVIPLNRYNFRSICHSDEIQIHCIASASTKGLLNRPQFGHNEILHQRVVLPGMKHEAVIDLTGSLIQIQDDDFVPFDPSAFIEQHFPLTVMETIRQNAVALSVLALSFSAIAISARFTAVQLTVAVLGMSLLVGTFNALSTANVFALLRDKLVKS